MKLLRATQNAELLSAEKAITERIHRQFLEGAKLQDVLKRPDTFFTEVNIENATDSVEKLSIKLNDKLTLLVSIYEFARKGEVKRSVITPQLKTLMDTGSIITDWNSLIDIIKSPKTQRNVSELLTGKIYALQDVINKIVVNYINILCAALIFESRTYRIHCVQLISNFGIYYVMQDQVLKTNLAKLTISEIQTFMTFDKIREMYSNNTIISWSSNFSRTDTNNVGYIGVIAPTSGVDPNLDSDEVDALDPYSIESVEYCKKDVINKYVNMFDNSDEVI